VIFYFNKVVFFGRDSTLELPLQDTRMKFFTICTK